MPEETKTPNSIADKVEVTGQMKIEQLRALVQPKGKKGTWLRHLSDRRLAEVYQRLRLGQSSQHIAKICQNEWSLMRNSKTESLTRALTKFRKQSIGEIQNSGRMTKEQKKESRQWEAKGDRIASELDGMKMLGWAIIVQGERLQELRKKELASMPLKMTDRVVKELVDSCEKYVNLQIRLGIRDSKPDELTLTIKEEFDGMLELVKSSPGGSTRMLDATRKLLSGVKEAAIDLEIDDETGEYRLVDEKNSKDNKPGESPGDSGDAGEVSGDGGSTGNDS